MPDASGAASVRPSLSGAALARILARHPPSPVYWIAYSGGLDSRVLLRLCAELRGNDCRSGFSPTPSHDWTGRAKARPTTPGPYNFAAVHVHHGLQAAADGWAEQCRAVCEAENIPFRLLRVDARPQPGQSPEEAARAARYQALRSIMRPGDTLLTAQHRDDQAETLLLQLLRGAGLAGLAAMPERAEFEPGFLLRPLLGFSRRELREYAEFHRLDWAEDPSNQDVGYDRNFIRHRVMPLLTERWPAAAETLSRSAGHCAEAHATLTALARDLFKTAGNPERGTLLIDHLLNCSDADRRLVLREWLRARGHRMPSAKVLDRVLNEALTAAPDRNPVIRWPEGEIRRYRNELYLLPPAAPFNPNAEIPWAGSEPLTLPDANGALVATLTEGPGLAPELWRTGTITVRYRQGGESLRPSGRQDSHELKKLCQEAGIPPWQRQRIPLVYIDGRLAAVGGWWIEQSFAGPADGRNVAIAWEQALARDLFRSPIAG
ncbi:tRNA lysidine(34) synthetase TilS [Methylomagnum sp.]